MCSNHIALSLCVTIVKGRGVFMSYSQQSIYNAGGGGRECPDGFKCQKVQVNCLEGAGTCSSSILCSKG